MSETIVLNGVPYRGELVEVNGLLPHFGGIRLLEDVGRPSYIPDPPTRERCYPSGTELTTRYDGGDWSICDPREVPQ
jgi:hypothetical protein